jgi:carbamoyltransferase
MNANNQGMTIVGIGGILKDAASAILKEGRVAAAIEESKVNRHWAPGEVPVKSILGCLKLADVPAADVQCVAIARPVATGPDLHTQLRSIFTNARLAVVEHQTAHAASAYYASGFDDATVLTLDRAGDFRCGARYHGSGNRLQLETEMYYPDSIGDLYSRVTEFLGFRAGADEHKIQWLSTSGEDQYTELFDEILGKDGARLNPAFFESNTSVRGGFSAKFYDRLGLVQYGEIKHRQSAAIARSLQTSVERAVLRLAGEGQNLCLGGGLFYNALLVSALESSGRWKNVFVQPVAGNAGTALGAALYAWHSVYRRTERAYCGELLLGPSYAAEEIKKVLENCKLRFRYLTVDELIDQAITLIQENQIVAWMQGRMEFGPRALGNRSILASPLNPYSTENLNAFIKHREPFRKFAASVPAELCGEYFDVGANARSLATVGRVKPGYRSAFEAAVMGDDLVRVHIVEKDDNPLYHRLLLAAGNSGGLPVLYNTSFNLFGDPLVCTPRDAVRSFYSSGIDSLFVGNFLVQK